MAQFLISGGVALHGTVAVSGAKNAALPMMAAALLADGPVRLENVPDLGDVRTMTLVLKGLGLEASRQADGALVIETVDPSPVRAACDLVGRMRAGFCVLGPLLARRGRAEVPLPGGCAIGERPIDLHVAGLAALGAEVRIDQGYVVARAGRLRGAEVRLLGPRGPTVTGTANVLSAAVLAEGETTITGAAAEPEIADLGRLLVAMGARIDGLGTPVIRVQGVRRLAGASHRIIPDRIEGATLLLAAAATQGEITVAGVVPQDLAAVLEKLSAAGCDVQVEGDRVTVAARDRLRPLEVAALPFPGVPSDVQAQVTAVLALAQGHSTVRDCVFPSRFAHVAELNRLGACIEHRDGAALITGVDRLTGAVVTATDLRASAALVLAGLAAAGQTVIRAIEHLDRGYERLDEKLRSLGARIKRRSSPTASRPG